MVCDFCGTKEPVWMYLAFNPILPVQGLRPGPWRVCSECGRLIEERDDEGLVFRAAHAVRLFYEQKSGQEMSEEMARAVEESIWTVYRTFEQVRYGDRQWIGQE